MKIEPFPWLRDYYVDMRKLYTELILEKIENLLLGETRWTLKGYVEMFDCKGRKKILIKGDPGMGKTTLCKKIGWDFANGLSKMFSMVFFIFLKFVNPGETIENVIIKQNPELEGLGVTAEKLHGLLGRFGERCLLILDGLDEHGLGQNEDVMKIIRNCKYINCGIVISSRPHITREIQINFSTVVRVGGFTTQEAERFVSNFFTDKSKIKQVMQFRPSNSDLVRPSIQQCPILLSFFCFLVAEQEIDLSDKTIDMGHIYMSLVKCLYKKFIIRKGKEFEKKDLFFIYKSVGKLAVRTLTSNNPLLERREVLRVVGEFAFDYGLFAGHEDFRLLGDPTADICVTYPHRSLEEFFGSIGFIDALSDGNSVDDILGSDCKKPIFMVNPLVLRFCLWFLSSQDFDFLQRYECYDKLTSYVAKRIDDKVFDQGEIEDRYPAIDMLHDNAKSQFFRDVLDKCKHVTTLHLNSSDECYNSEDVDKFFSLMNRDFIDRLTTIIINYDEFSLNNTDNNSLILSIFASSDSEALEITNLLLHKYNLSGRNPQIYVYIFCPEDVEDHDITVPLSVPSHVLHIENDVFGVLLIASGEFPHSPTLTDLTIVQFHIDESVSSELRKAMHNGKLPNLRRVTLKRCCEHSSRLDWPEEVQVSVIDEESKDECYTCESESEEDD